MTQKQYRKVFVIQLIKADFSPLGTVTGNIEFVTTGLESSEELAKLVELKLLDFDPSSDAIIPSGKASTCLLVGMELAKRFKGLSVNVGIFRSSDTEKHYDFMEVQIA